MSNGGQGHGQGPNAGQQRPNQLAIFQPPTMLTPDQFNQNMSEIKRIEALLEQAKVQQARGLQTYLHEKEKQHLEHLAEQGRIAE